MKNKLDELKVERVTIIELAKKHKAFNVAVFGSVARMSENPESDIDFLVDFESGASLFDQAALRIDLSELLNSEIDLLSRGALRTSDSNILQDAISI
jgi:predicted nucleotidyltransferase